MQYFQECRGRARRHIDLSVQGHWHGGQQKHKCIYMAGEVIRAFSRNSSPVLRPLDSHLAVGLWLGGPVVYQRNEVTPGA